MASDAYEYVRSCHGFQKASNVPEYRTTMGFCLKGLLDNFAIGFAVPFRAAPSAERHVLVAVEHSSG